MESVLILCDKGPFGTNIANEAIRLGAGFIGLGEDVNCKLVFLGDAVLFMKKNLQPGLIGMDSLEEGVEMADLTELSVVLVREDMESRGMSEEDLRDYENLSVISISELTGLINEYPTVFKI